MVQNNKVAFIPFRYFLWLIALFFAVAATLLIMLFTFAATATGSTPATAISMANGVNTGILGPGEQRWFRIIPPHQAQTDSVEKALVLTFSPGHNSVSQYVRLQVFDQTQMPFDFNAADESAVLGQGQAVSLDQNPDAGELLWRGSLRNDRTYYIRLLNDSDFPLDYWLVANNVVSPPAIEVEPEVQPPAQPAPVVAEPETGLDPANPTALQADLNQGRLQPNETHWYAFTPNNTANSNAFQDMDFSLFFTPDDGNRRHHVNFELFSAHEVENWWRNGQDSLHNFGAGMLVSRDGDFFTGERIWRGTVLKGNTYYLAVQNGSDLEVDYRLFNDDVQRIEFGDTPEPEPKPIFAAGAAPQTAIPLLQDKTTGGLEPGQEMWYSFSMADNDSEAFEEMALTMIVTPDDGNRIRQITFDVFTAQGVRTWSPDNPEGITNVGAGSVVYRDNNALTGERFWSGWVVDNDLYFVRLRNSSDIHIDYWLFNGDVYRPELGP